MENSCQESSIRTGRLTLRPFVPEDSVELYRIESQSAMVRYQDFEPRTIENAAEYVNRAIKGGEGYLEFAVCLTGDEDTIIGRVGSLIEGEFAWIWFVIAPECQGKGYAREAADVLIQHLFSTKPLKAVQIECDPRNEASWRLAESLGFTLIKEESSGIWIKGEEYGSRIYRREA